MSYANSSTASQEVVWMQLTAGQGPKECGWVVAQLLREVLQEAIEFDLKAEMVESLAFDKPLRKQSLVIPDAYLSALIRVEGKGSKVFAQRWAGSIKWQGESRYRKKHKRSNWFVGVELVDVPVVKAIELKVLQKEVTFESMRASGPGGQHVNKTSSAVRVTHRSTGIQVRVESDRSQHRNRQLAMERLQMLLVAGGAHDEREQGRLRWLNHYQVRRGRPTREFSGSAFIEKKQTEN